MLKKIMMVTVATRIKIGPEAIIESHVQVDPKEVETSHIRLRSRYGNLSIPLV